MPAKDMYHDTVVAALEKDGWDVFGEQVYLVVESRHFFLDMAARNQIRGTIIVVEVKSFISDEGVMDFIAAAIGKYMLYRIILDLIDDKRPLYMAVPIHAYNGVLRESISQQLLAWAKVLLLVFDPVTEEVVEWIST